jgi:hypothetical protein
MPHPPFFLSGVGRKGKRYFLMAFASPKAIKTHYSEFSQKIAFS